jgi:hypothetical protein
MAAADCCCGAAREVVVAQPNIFDFWRWPLEVVRTAAGFGETLWNAHAVIGVRTPMIKAAFFDPLGADTRELTRMVTEKWDAFGQSGRVLAAGERTICGAMTANARDFGRMAAGELFWPADWWRLAERNMALWSAVSTLPGAALEPVRTQVASNARRLRA